MNGLKSQFAAPALLTIARADASVAPATSAALAVAAAEATPHGTALPEKGRREALRHDNNIASLQRDVLIEVPATNDICVTERQRLLLAAIRPTQDHDIAQRGERSCTPRHAERLHHIHARIDDEIARLIDLA